jgi:hypothetical protein
MDIPVKVQASDRHSREVGALSANTAFAGDIGDDTGNLSVFCHGVSL